MKRSSDQEEPEVNRSVEVVTAEAPFPWESLPTDLKNYMMQRMNPQTLFALRQTDWANWKRVTGFLRTISAPNLLRLLPVYVPDSEDGQAIEARRQACHAAVLEVLKFQNLYRYLDNDMGWCNELSAKKNKPVEDAEDNVVSLKSVVQSRYGVDPSRSRLQGKPASTTWPPFKFRPFQTIEEGIMALMTVPLNKLDPVAVKSLIDDTENRMPSETVDSEFIRLEKRFGEGRVFDIITKIKKFQHNHEPEDVPNNDDALKVLVLMILRASRDEVVQNCLVECHCLSSSDISYSLLNLYEYAKKNNKQRILEMLAWLTDKKEVEVKDALESMKVSESETDIRAATVFWRLGYLIAQPDCFDKNFPLVTKSVSSVMDIYVLKDYYVNNPTFWTCALLRGSWEEAINMCATVKAHVDVIMQMRNEPRIVFTHQEPQDTPFFVNLSELDLQPECLVDRLGGDYSYYRLECADLRGARFHQWGVDGHPNPAGFLTMFNACIMDDVELQGFIIRDCSFVNMNIARLQPSAYFINCRFDKIRLSHATFPNIIDSCLFIDCQFSPTVRFIGAFTSEEGTAQPVIFQRCEFEGESIPDDNNVRFINCSFPKGMTPLKSSLVYMTENQDTDSVEGAYQLFNELKHCSDNAMIVYLQKKLLQNLTQQKAVYKIDVIDVEEDRMYREILGYQFTTGGLVLNLLTLNSLAKPTALVEYEKLELSIVNRVQSITLP